jgi:hypothetical protein
VFKASDEPKPREIQKTRCRKASQSEANYANLVFRVEGLLTTWAGVDAILSSKRRSLYESDDPIYVIDPHRAARSSKHHTSVRGLQERIGLFVRRCPDPPSFIPASVRADLSSDTHQLRIPRILDDRHAAMIAPIRARCELQAMPATLPAVGYDGNRPAAFATPPATCNRITLAATLLVYRPGSRSDVGVAFGSMTLCGSRIPSTVL